MNRTFTAMLTKKFFLILSLFLSSAHAAIPDWEQSPYFDTDFLYRFDEVRASLIKEGFKEVIIPTHDGLNLSGLILERPQARYNVISCVGFYPGRKESMATLLPLLPSDCNILLFEARGHGSSQGPFLTNLHHYGLNEYKDVIGALEFVHARNQLPIIIHSICAGSFHATRALIHLQQKALLSAFNVLGLIFDSGFASILQAYQVPEKHFSQKIIPAFLTKLYKNDSKKTVQDRRLYKISATISRTCIGGIEWCMKYWIDAQEPETNFIDTIKTLNCPIFFIHAMNDSYVAQHHVATLAATVHHKSCWWIENSEHACNHLKFKQEYRKRLHEFIDTLLLNYHS